MESLPQPGKLKKKNACNSSRELLYIIKKIQLYVWSLPFVWKKNTLFFSFSFSPSVSYKSFNVNTYTVSLCSFYPSRVSSVSFVTVYFNSPLYIDSSIVISPLLVYIMPQWPNLCICHFSMSRYICELNSQTKMTGYKDIWIY